MTDRYTTAGYLIAGITGGTAAALLIIALLNLGEPWAVDLAHTVAVVCFIAVAIISALVLASVLDEHRQRG